MPSNLTIDDYSPLIQYKGPWFDYFNTSINLDSNVGKYWDTSFHSSFTNGSTATLTFKGIAIYIFGAKRGNHGYYHVSVDGEPGRRFDGFVGLQPGGADGVYQVPLFAREGLADGQHTVTLTNIVNAPARRPFVDIDYITWTQNNDVSFNSKIVGDPEFQYSTPTSVWTARVNAAGVRGGTVHSTNTYGAAASLTFEGSEMYLYGSTGPNYGQLKIQLDNQPALELNGTAPTLHTQTLLYTTSDLTAGEHQLVITNLGDNRALDIDYAEIVPLQSKSSSGLTRGAIAGIAVGIAVGISLIALLLWYFFIYRRRKNKRRFSMDLMAEASDDSHPTAVGSYSNDHLAMVTEPYADHPNPTSQGQSTPYGGGGGTVGERTERANSQPDVSGRRQDRRKGTASAAVNRGSDEPGLRPEAMTSEGESSLKWTVETDGGALPPLYDQIESSRVADIPVRI